MPGYAIQEQNEDQSTLLASQFRLLYNPSHAFADAINMALMFPALRGFWPGSAVGPAGEMNDLSGNGLHLTNNSNPLFNSENLIPHTEYDGAADYHSHLDQADFDIIGTEAYISDNGLTIGCWVNFDDALPALSERIMGKMGNFTIAQLSYAIRRDTGGGIRFSISDGAAINTVVSVTAIDATGWNLISCRLIPSTSQDIFLNGSIDISDTTSIPASINNSTSAFTIAASSVPANFMDGKISLAFLCASALSDSFINTFFQMTAPLFKTSI